MDNRVIYSVEPFNRFALGGCFEYGYIPAYTFFGGAEIDIFLNTVIYFRYIDTHFCVSKFDDKNKKEMEKLVGICSREVWEYDSNIVSTIVNSLKKKRLVMIRGAEFEAYDANTLHSTGKSLSEHWLLCFGYDLENETIDILEHQTVISAKYKHCKIKFEELEKAYSFNLDNRDCFNSLVIWSDFSRTNNNNNKQKYIQKIGKYQDKYKQSEESLITFLNELANCAESKEDFPEEHINLSVEVIKAIQKESWVMETCGYHYDVTDLIKYLNLVRAFQTKCELYPNNRSYQMLIDYSALAIKCVRDYYSYILGILQKGQK